MKVAFNHVRELATTYSKELQRAFAQVVRSGVFLHGSFEKKLQLQLSEYLDIPFVIPVASGHDALLLAIQSVGLGAQDEVLFQVNAYPTAFPIALAHCTPVGVDCDHNGQIDLNDLEKKYTAKTKAVIVTHMYGFCGDIEKIQTWAKKKKISLIEDCAQAFGSKYKGKCLGSFGEIACYSLYPSKNLATLGDGGFITTRSKKIARFLEKAASYGEANRYNSEFISGHSRLPELQAAAASVYLKHFSLLVKKRHQVFTWYTQEIAKQNMSKVVRILGASDWGDRAKETEPVPHLCVLVVQERADLQKYLKVKNIETAIHYPISAHQVTAFQKYSFSKNSYPQAEQLSSNILSLPFHQYLSHSQVAMIVKNIQKFYEAQTTI